jgi:hypothetical protein
MQLGEPEVGSDLLIRLISLSNTMGAMLYQNDRDVESDIAATVVALMY